MKGISRAPFLLLLTLVLASFSHAQLGETGSRGPRSCSGTVYYADTGDPAPRIEVELRNSEGLVVGHGMTNDAGGFLFTGLMGGVYEMTINTLDYEPVSQKVDLSLASSHGNVLDLQKRGAVMRPHTVGPAVSAHLLSMPEKARNAYDAGKKKLYQNKDPQAGIAKFLEAIAAAPKFYEAYEQMGMAYLQLGKTADAEAAVRKSIELSEDKYAAADVDLGVLLLDKRQYTEGEKVVRHGLELDSKSWLGHYELGRALFLEHRVTDAQKSAEECRALKPDFPMIYRLLANIHVSQHDKAALLQDLDEYIRLDPDSPAGIRAKQMREKLQRTVKSSPTTTPKSSNLAG
jgi:hypothetical protein